MSPAMPPAAFDGATFLDVLIPGDGAWPAASAALAEPAALDALLSREDAAWLRRRDRDLLDMVAEDRVAAMERLEEEQPVRFGRVLAALYEAYYNAAPALAEVRRLAEAGPREPSPHFDPSLLGRVVETDAGRRRL